MLEEFNEKLVNKTTDLYEPTKRNNSQTMASLYTISYTTKENKAKAIKADKAKVKVVQCFKSRSKCQHEGYFNS